MMRTSDDVPALRSRRANGGHGFMVHSQRRADRRERARRTSACPRRRRFSRKPVFAGRTTRHFALDQKCGRAIDRLDLPRLRSPGPKRNDRLPSLRPVTHQTSGASAPRAGARAAKGAAEGSRVYRTSSCCDRICTHRLRTRRGRRGAKCCSLDARRRCTRTNCGSRDGAAAQPE